MGYLLEQNPTHCLSLPYMKSYGPLSQTSTNKNMNEIIEVADPQKIRGSARKYNK
jgi:hypothetical protein